MGPTFYMVEVADDPAFRAVFGLGMDQIQWMQSPTNITIPDEGDIPIELCLHPNFPLTNDVNRSHVMHRQVTPTRMQNDFGPTEWKEIQPWSMTGFNQTTIRCELLDGSNGTTVIANIPVPETSVGEIHYRAMLGTTNGAFPINYPAPGEEPGDYYVMTIPTPSIAPSAQGRGTMHIIVILSSCYHSTAILFASQCHHISIS